MFSRWRDVWRKLRGDGTKARTQFADARWSRTSTPCPGVWMRVPLVHAVRMWSKATLAEALVRLQGPSTLLTITM
eukprot:792389-Pelagomonas_calceolata.AAC.2